MIDFSKVLTDLDGHLVKEQLADMSVVELTLGRAAANALVTPVPGEPPIAGAEHIARFQLALKVKDAAEMELSTSEIETIKARIAKFYTNSALVGRAWLLLDPALAP